MNSIWGDRDEALPAGWAQLTAELGSLPEPERVVALAARDDSSARAVERADRLLRQHGYGALGDRWIGVDAETARQIAARLLAQDLDDERPIMPAAAAERAASAFVALLSPATFLTNGSWCTGAAPLSADARVGPFWTPVSRATFDGGVVAVAARFVAAVWVIEPER